MTDRRLRIDRAGTPRRAGFSLVELMVVVAIIALLVGILLPSFSSVTTQAKVTKTAALFQALTAANESFRGDQQIGGSYVPSQTDSEGDTGTFSQMANPLSDPPGNTTFAPVSGASLLVYGLAGADALGTPGFRDLGTNGFWWDDQHNTQTTDGPTTINGSYYLDPAKNMEPGQPRYGPYVGEKALGSISTFDDLRTSGVIVADSFTGSGTPNPCRQQKVFVDAWDQPILYYRARSAASFMVTVLSGHGGSPRFVGVYDQRDNQYLTGFDVPIVGIDMGAGTDHMIRSSTSAPPDPNGAGGDLSATMYNDTFAQFIWDRDVTQRNVPVNRETFLLISAGPDALYGTADDVVNWTRK